MNDFSSLSAVGQCLGECDWILYSRVREGEKNMETDDALWEWVHLLPEEKRNEV